MWKKADNPPELHLELYRDTEGDFFFNESDEVVVLRQNGEYQIARFIKDAHFCGFVDNVFEGEIKDVVCWTSIPELNEGMRQI